MRIFSVRSRRPLFAALLLAGGVALSACATTSGPPPDPQKEALQRGQKTILSGIEGAWKKSESVDEWVVRARQNPGQCDAPPDEIYIHGRWTRVYLQGEEALLGSLKKTQSIAAERVRIETVLVRGGLSGEMRPSERGIVYPVFEVRALE